MLDSRAHSEIPPIVVVRCESRSSGKERDTETGLDYFGARYYGSNMGRFTSPDPIQQSPKHLQNPQRWNAYSYVRNNPLALIDPDGLDDFKVFIGFNRQDVAPSQIPNFTQFNRNGHTVEVFAGKRYTEANYREALKQQGVHVVDLGHVSQDGGKGVAVQLNDGDIGLGFRLGAIPNSPPSDVKAASVAVFGCNSSDLPSQYAGTGTYTGVQSNGNLSNSVTLSQEAQAYMSSATSRPGKVDLKAAGNAAQNVINNSQNLEPSTRQNIDKDDKIRQVQNPQ